MIEQRSHWHERLAAVPSARLVFVDESGANTKMTRLYGRSPVGERLVTHIPHGHYQTSTLIAAVRLRGPCAPWLFEGAMDGEMFLAWVRQGLVPTLQPDDWVILDNLATHKVAGVRETIEATGAPAIFLEAGNNSDVAQQLAQESGVRVVTDLYIHSLGKEAPTYLDMLRWDVKLIVEALR